MNPANRIADEMVILELVSILNVLAGKGNYGEVWKDSLMAWHNRWIAAALSERDTEIRRLKDEMKQEEQ